MTITPSILSLSNDTLFSMVPLSQEKVWGVQQSMDKSPKETVPLDKGEDTVRHEPPPLLLPISPPPNYRD